MYKTVWFGKSVKNIQCSKRVKSLLLKCESNKIERITVDSFKKWLLQGKVYRKVKIFI